MCEMKHLEYEMKFLEFLMKFLEFRMKYFAAYLRKTLERVLSNVLRLPISISGLLNIGLVKNILSVNVYLEKMGGKRR